MVATQKLVQIGNSYGIRIPKIFIDQAGLRDTEISLQIINDSLVLKPVKKPRADWDTPKIREKIAKESEISSEFETIDLNSDEWQW